MRNNPETTVAVAFLLALALSLAAFIYLAVQDDLDYDRCTDSGGVVERYDRRDTPVVTPCGSGCVVVTTVEVSQWRCRR